MEFFLGGGGEAKNGLAFNITYKEIGFKIWVFVTYRKAQANIVGVALF